MEKNLKATGFVFNKIVIIESLSSDDIKTGSILKISIDQCSSSVGLNLPVDYISCQSRQDILDSLDQIVVKAKAYGEIPIVHFECHGNSQIGLFCADDSVVDWNDLKIYLTRINEATAFNLLAVFSACHGGHFLKNLSPLAPCPCWAMIGPTDEFDAADAMGGFRSFYRTAIETRDIGLAASALKGHSLSEGKWLIQHCEIWFEVVVKNYILRLCDKNAVRQRTKLMHRRLIDEGKRNSIGSLKRKIKKLNKKNLSGELFDSYFMVEKIPQNKGRFAEARSRITKIIKKLASTGRYAI